MAEVRVVSWDGETVLIEVEVSRSALRALAAVDALRRLARELGAGGYGQVAARLEEAADMLEETAMESIRRAAQASAEAALRQVAADFYGGGG